MKHGRAVIPFGKYKGVRVRIIPDDYLSWLMTAKMMKDPRWTWLRDSVIAELKFRGLRYDLAATDEPEIDMPTRETNDNEMRAIEVFNKMSCYMR